MITQLPNNHIGVQVPENQGNDFEIIRDQDNYDQQQLKYPSDKYNGLQNYSWVNLPPGKYSIVGLAIDLTEEDWRGIVEHRYEYGNSKSKGVLITKDYVNGYSFDTFKKAGYSLLESKGLAKETTLILKQVL